MNYLGKHILVLGLGRSGLAAARLLNTAGAIVTVADSGNSSSLQERAAIMREKGVKVVLGEDAPNFLEPSYDRAILSPGIDPSSLLVRQVLVGNTPLVGELELAYDFCQCPIVAITGTNGKTTTTELTVAGLKGAGLKTMACGNIGVPFSEVVLQSSELDVIIIEVSSFQLETVERFHAHIAVWLNLSPNHLDRYVNVDEYREAKLRIFRNQTLKDAMIIPAAFDNKIVLESKAKKLTFSSQDKIADFFFDGVSIQYHQQPLLEINQTQLRGAHNAENMMAALAVGMALNVEPQKMIKGISEYRSLPHRCELVADREGVLWINDSKSTTLDAMEKALRSIEKNRRILLIAGGKNKGSSFSSILPLIKDRVKEAVLLGEMRHSIAQEWVGVTSHLAGSMEEAVQLAGTHAMPGDVVLLSPGTSSYDMFKDYEERGNQFKAVIEQLFSKKIASS